MLFDAHCHLQDSRLSQCRAPPSTSEGETEEAESEEAEKRRWCRLDAVGARARASGLVGCVVCATSELDWPLVAALADRHPGFVHPSFGLHPWYLSGRKPGWEQRLEELLRSRPGAGVGESGLDKAKTTTNKSKTRRQLPSIEEQLEVLAVHARIARELRRPLTVHCVRAAGALHDALLPFRPFLKSSTSISSPPSSSSSPPSSFSSASAPPLLLSNTCVIFHGWQGPKEEVARLSRLGEGVFFSLGARSIAKAVSAAAAAAAAATATTGGAAAAAGKSSADDLSSVPLERLLMETDSPDGFEPLCLGEGLLAAEAEAAGGEGEGDGEGEVGEERATEREGKEKPKEKLLNQPSNVAALLPHLARALGRDEREVARACYENARAVFCGE